MTNHDALTPTEPNTAPEEPDTHREGEGQGEGNGDDNGNGDDREGAPA